MYSPLFSCTSAWCSPIGNGRRSIGASAMEEACLGARLDVEPHCDAFELGLWRGVAAQYERVVARNDMRGRTGEALYGREAFEHVADVEDRRIGTHLLEIGVEMRGVGGQHDPAAPCLDAHHLQPVGVPADMVHGNAGGDLASAVVKLYTAGEQAPDHRADIVLLERTAQLRVAHAA